MKLSDFQTITRSRSQNYPFNLQEIKASVSELLPVQRIREQGVRLLGTTMSNFHVEETKTVKQIEIDFGTEDSL